MTRTTRSAPTILALSAIVTAATALSTPFAAFAQTKPATQRVLTRGASDSGHELPRANAREHVFYGRIDAIRGGTLTVRTRAGRSQLVDASEAIRSGSYSEPLFIGKIVVVTGSYAANRTLRASSVMRMGGLDAGTPADR